MKFLKQILLIITVFNIGNIHAQQEEVCYNPNLIKDTTKKSIKSMAVGTIGGDSVTIRYHSPGVRKRIIWGGLVPFDEVWVTGAHDATSVEFSKTVLIAGKQIPAGKYAFFSIPGKEEWTLIINKKWEQHLTSEYDEAEDLVRVNVKPEKIPHTERLQYFIEEDKDGNERISVAWEEVKVGLPINFKN
jgi:hypothetical protein